MADRNLPALAPAALPTGGDLNTLLQIGDMLVKSGLLPQTLRTKEAAAVVVMKGNELGLPPMAALEGISVVQGRAVIGAHLMLALVKRAYGPGAIWVSETTNDHCTISYRIPGVAEILSYTYTMADARTAGLADKPTWRQHPAAMLRARAISATVKLAFPEVVGGMYVPGEIDGTEETVTPDGDVVILVSPAAAPAAPAAPPTLEAVEAEIVDAETGEIVEAEPVPRPSKRSLGQRALALAMERQVTPEALEALGVRIAEGRAKRDWEIADLQKLVAHLEEMPIPDPQPELIAAEPMQAEGEAGGDPHARGWRAWRR